MKTLINIITLVFAVTFVAIAAQNYISTLNASSDGKNVTVRWTTIDEVGLDRFEIERSNSEGYFTSIGEDKAKGSPGSYEFVDDNELMKDSDNESLQNQTQYTYRIKIVKKDQSFEYSSTVSVTHNTSSIRKTWGMIKEMFR